MERKVFISFLGTNNYVECRYKFADKISKPVRFVQEALIEHTCKDWAEKDKILIFCTSKETTGDAGSKEINWFDNGQSRITEDSERIGLQQKLQDLKKQINLRAEIEEIDIEAGFSEQEIWRIFETVVSNLQFGDQIYFDVTHAFRSIPLFSIVLFNYSKYMMGTQLRKIMYGAFEKLGPAYKVKEQPINERIAPIIDLTNIARLQEYNQLASSLKESGKVKKIRDVIPSDREDISDQAVRDLRNSISELDEYIATIDLKEIKSGKFISKFRNNYKNIKKRNIVPKPIYNILDELYNETSDFVGEPSYKNIEAAINWTIKHDMLMQAYPLTEEYIILRVADLLIDIKPNNLSMKDYRKFVSAMLGIPQKDFDAKIWKEMLAQYPDVADDMSEDFLIKEIRPLYDDIRRSRNSLAHGNGAIKYSELLNNIPKIIKCVSYLNAEYEQYPSTLYIKEHMCNDK